MPEFLINNERLLFILLLLVSTACIVLLMALVYWVIGKFRAARPLIRPQAAAERQPGRQSASLGKGPPCCPESYPAGACCR